MAEVSDLAAFSLEEMTHCLAATRKLGHGATTMEEAAGRIVSFLYERFRDDDGAPQCALVRLFKMIRYGALTSELQAAVQERVGSPPADLSCLTLLATRGREEAWNDRRRSRSHRVLPVPTIDAVAGLPMVARLLEQLEYDDAGAAPDDHGLFLEEAGGGFNVFHVEEARGSAYIPAQEDFVAPHGVQSVVGFGGELVDRDFFAVIMFCNVVVPRAAAELFGPLTLGIKLALLPFCSATSTVFADASASEASK